MGGNHPGAGITHGPNMTFGWLTAHHIADRATASRTPALNGQGTPTHEKAA